MTMSPLRTMTETTPTALWNDSSTLSELTTAIGWGAVGATCNPVIALAAIRSDLPRWQARIAEIAADRPTATESQIGWQVVEEVSIEAAKYLEPAFDEHQGRNGRLSMQTDPRLHRDAAALADQAEYFASLAPNIIVKIPATKVGIVAIEEATYRGVSINVTVSFTVPQAVEAGAAIERGLSGARPRTRRPRRWARLSRSWSGAWTTGSRPSSPATASTSTPGTWSGPASRRSRRPTRSSSSAASRPGCSPRPTATSCSGPSWSAATSCSPRRSAGRRSSRPAATTRSSRIDEPVDPAILDALLTIPDFVRAYEVDGMTHAEFDDFGATRTTLRQFLEADEALDQIVRDVIVPAP